MDLRKRRTNSSELNQMLKNLNFEADEHKEPLNTLIASKVLGVGWNEKSDTFYFDSSDLGTFLSKRINTEIYLLQATGQLFDPVGFIGPYTIRIRCLIQKIWCVGLDWDDKLPKQLEVSWNKCTKATHLEVVSDLTTEAFLASLRRFIARRSKPSVIWSDNATNFKGARNILNVVVVCLLLGYIRKIREFISGKRQTSFPKKIQQSLTRYSNPNPLGYKPRVIATILAGRLILNEWNEISKSNTIQLFSAEEGIEWRNFIPPASPHFGGLWEGNIKSMKRILLRVAKSSIRNFNQNAISTFPESYTASDSLSYHSRWKLIQSLRDKFWNRWSTEYLTHLQTRAKWSVQNPNLTENQLVLLKDPNTKPLDWPMGRILEVFPGSDGLVRVVNVKTSTGILKRAITKVVPLPTPDDPTTAEKNI
ncbi:integrase catalytic domain-containing protein [Trichonephila clavipes]|nr:integrase catalytic domain-containing protein [Trichonephila clavipes]